MKATIYFVLLIMLLPIMAAAQAPPQQSVYFAPTEFQLEPKEQTVIDDFLKNLPTNPLEYSILLVGHTDNVGDADYNQKLSQQRCKTVKDYLLTLGFKPSQLAYQSKGYNIPVASNETIEGKAQNRRVEMVVLPKNALSSSPIQVPQETVVFDAEKGTNYTYERSGTVVQIPANSLVFADGTPVKGQVEMQYREFRDFADFFATDIPMTFDHQHQFESAGMFEVNASQNGKKVFVKEGEYINVEFMMTSDTVENLNFYEYGHNEWTAVGKLDRTTQENVFDVRVPCKKRYHYPMPPIQGDTLQTFMNAMRVGYYMATESDLEQFGRIGFLSLDDRFADKRYAGTAYLGHEAQKIEWNTLDKIDKLLPIHFKYNEDYIQLGDILDDVKLSDGLIAQFDKAMTEFPEMKDLSKRAWQVLPKGVYTSLERVKKLQKLDKPYMDIRVKYLGENNFEFVLKGIRGIYDTLVMQPVFEKTEQRKKDKEKICQTLSADYNRILNARRTAFDERMVFYKENWKYFLAFSKSVMPKSEQCRSLNGWLSDFEKKRAIMEARYYPYTGLEGNIADIKPLVTNAVYGNRVLLDSLPPTPRQRLVQGLAIGGFGVFNCDAIQRMGPERVEVELEFLTEAGGQIDPKIINVIDYSMNGILRLDDASKVSFNPTKKTAFVVTDYAGEVYLVSAEEVNKQKYKKDSKVAYHLNAKKISATTTNVIRDAIAAR